MGMGGKSQKGGSINKAKPYTGAGSNVLKEAKMRKFGGKIVGGIKSTKKARGGACGPSPFSAAHKSMKGDA